MISDRQTITYIALFIFFLFFSKVSLSQQVTVRKDEVLLCQNIEVFREHNQYMADGLYAKASDYPPPPICVDVYEGQLLEGPFSESYIHSVGKLDEFKIEYVQVAIGSKKYWGMSNGFFFSPQYHINKKEFE